MPRILIVAGYAETRELLREVMLADGRIEIAGVAEDGVAALAATAELRPDLVLMVVPLARLDAAATTSRIMATTPTPIVLVETDPADAGLRCRQPTAGAVAVTTLPPRRTAAGFAAAAEALVRLILAMAEVKVVRTWRTCAGPEVPRRPGRHYRVLAIAASTGGPAALQAVLSGLPADFALPILVVQHIADGFIGLVADWLGQVSGRQVVVAAADETLLPGVVYLAPDQWHLGVSARFTVELSRAPPVGGFRPSANHLFDSVAQHFGRTSLAVMLTGMGSDGVTGLRALKAAGATVLAQDEASAVVYGMPGAAVRENLVDAVLPLDAIAARLMGLTGGRAG